MLDINIQKEKLLKEKVRLEGILSSIARKNPDNSSDWEPVETDLNTDQADESDVAEAIENFQLNAEETGDFEKTLAEVNNALLNIENGTYGKCSVCGNDIDKDRLEVIPFATVCKLHM